MKKLLYISGAAFVISWIAGLLTVPATLEPDAGGAAIIAHYTTDDAAGTIQPFFVAAIPGLALIGLAIAFSNVYCDRRVSARLRRVIVGTGLAAGGVSLTQFILGETLSVQAGGVSADSARALFVVLNDLDTVKIALLALMIAAVGIAARKTANLRRWLTAGSLAFAPVLAVSGLAFPLNSGVIYALLYLTLPLLLLWVAFVSVSLARRETRAARRPIAVAA